MINSEMHTPYAAKVRLVLLIVNIYVLNEVGVHYADC